LILVVVLCMAVVSIQWWIWGYSLAFSPGVKTDDSGWRFIGDLDHAFFIDVWDQPIPMTTVPMLLFAIFQCMFAAITPALALGSAAERGRIVPMIVFTFIWSTLVYDVIACWTWNAAGWSNLMGGLDFAGGTPVHISSGAASLAYCIIVGKRTGNAAEFKPHNIANVVLGTGLLWFGWFGFNGGSALAANMRAVMAIVVTNLAAAAGGLTWALIDYIRERKLSALGFCSGAVAGLVGITPASGFVGTWAAFVIGVVAGAACNIACKLKRHLGFDDAADVFGVHCIGGIFGNLLTGIFASSKVALLDNTVIPGGWIDGHWMQILYQLADSAAGFSYSFVVTYIILSIMDRIPGLSLRADAETEARGMDLAELGELAYQYVSQRMSIAAPATSPGGGRRPTTTRFSGGSFQADTDPHLSHADAMKQVKEMQDAKEANGSAKPKSIMKKIFSKK